MPVLNQRKLSKPLFGAALTVLCGLALWGMPLGERWVNASYDYFFRFPVAETMTNKMVLIWMDNNAYDHYRQSRNRPWDRGLHAELLERLAKDACPLVVLDAFLREPGPDQSKDEALARAIRKLPAVVLMAEQADVAFRRLEAAVPSIEAARPVLPTEPFLEAARTNWGVACLDKDLDLIVRRHWPFPSPGPYQSLPSKAALLAGARLSPNPEERWLRYYGPDGAWETFSYPLALTQASNYFRDKIVFIGNKPKTSLPDDEKDKFRTPYTRWRGEAVGGAEIMATEFLNLVNADWLRRPSWWVEISALVLSGLFLGGFFSQLRPTIALGLGVASALAVMLLAVWLTQATNYWFPWLVVAAGQVPCAVVWALVGFQFAPSAKPVPTVPSRAPDQSHIETVLVSAQPAQDKPDAPDYEVFPTPFAEGAYGKVWLARNAIGQWQALKTIYRAKFGAQVAPYDREFKGIQRYKPVSDKHPGLLRVDFVSKQKEAGYFYYVMELGDALQPGWEQDPSLYIPCDLAQLRGRAEGRRLPPPECLRVGLALAEALEFLHQQGLTHRDIKPQNIIFVRGRPKLGDVGLVTDVLPTGLEGTYVGTPGYMPPSPEGTGTPKADIYGLGMVLYVILTGREPQFFPELATTLAEHANPSELIALNSVVLRACHPDTKHRYASAGEMADALRQIASQT